MPVTGQTFSDIADAIRSKTGKSGTMKITQMAEEIESIETGSGAILTVTASNGSESAGITVTASNGETDYTGVFNSEGIVGITVAPGYDYTVTESSGEALPLTVHVDAEGASAILKWATIWGADITIATSSPWSRVTYPTDVENAGYTPASGHSINGWAGSELISDIAPVKIVSGVKTYLDKRNPTKTLSGEDSNISTNGNDAFVEFPLKWLAVTSDGTKIYIRFANVQVDDTYQCYAHRYNGVNQSAFYYGMFLGYVTGSKLFSQGSTTPTTDTSITNFIAYAKARGAGYDLATFYQTMYIECLLIVLFKTTDIQGSSDTAHGLAKGYVEGSAKQISAVPYFSNDYGMAGSTSSTTTRMSALWVNDFYGNCYTFIGGAKTNSSWKLLTIVDRLSSVTESDFEKTIDIGMTANGSGYVTGVKGTTEAVLIPNAFSGSSTTYWADYGYVAASYFPRFGGYWNDGDYVGFNWAFYSSATSTHNNISSRLSYRIGIA